MQRNRIASPRSNSIGPPLRGRIPRKVLPALSPAAESKRPKGPAWTPRKPRPAPKRVDHPQRLRVGSRPPEAGGVFVADNRWGCPFRPREIDGRWVVAWTGAELGIEHLRPVGWEDVSCQDRQEAAHVALEAFAAWVGSPELAPGLEHARRSLKGFNLVCLCPPGHPCHGDLLLEIVNRPEKNMP
jgi:hypothetical protein